MSKRNIATEILEGIHEIKQFKNGRGKLKTSDLSQPSPPHVIRLKLNLSQSEFAGLMGVSVRTLRIGSRVADIHKVQLLRYCALPSNIPKCSTISARADEYLPGRRSTNDPRQAEICLKSKP